MRISDWSSDVCSSDLRAEQAGYKGIVVTLDTWVTGWRPRDLSTANFPQLRGHCLANYTSDPVFRPRLARTDRQSVVWGKWVSVRVDPGGRRSIKKKRPASYTHYTHAHPREIKK